MVLGGAVYAVGVPRSPIRYALDVKASDEDGSGEEAVYVGHPGKISRLPRSPAEQGTRHGTNERSRGPAIVRDFSRGDAARDVSN